MNEDRAIIDTVRSCILHDVGGGHCFAATLVWPEFTTLAILNTDHLEIAVPIDAQCRATATRHEQIGPLPADIVEQVIAAHDKRHPTPKGDDQ